MYFAGVDSVLKIKRFASASVQTNSSEEDDNVCMSVPMP